MLQTNRVRKEKAVTLYSPGGTASSRAGSSDRSISRISYGDYVRNKKAEQQSNGVTQVTPRKTSAYTQSIFDGESPSTGSYTDHVQKKKAEPQIELGTALTRTVNPRYGANTASEENASVLSYADYVKKKKAESSTAGSAQNKKMQQLIENANMLFEGLSNLSQAYNDRMSEDRKTFVSGADATAWHRQVKQHLSTFEHGRDLLTDQLEQYRPYLGDEYVDNFLQHLNSGNDAVATIREGSQAYVDFRTSFAPTEHQIALGQTEEMLFQDWLLSQTYLPKYGGKSTSVLARMLEDLEEGEERTWLEGYIGSLKYQETIHMDMEAAQDRLDYLLENRTQWSSEYRKLEEEQKTIEDFGMTADGSDPERKLRAIKWQKRQILEKAGVSEISRIDEEIAELTVNINRVQQNQQLIVMESVADPQSANYDPSIELFRENTQRGNSIKGEDKRLWYELTTDEYKIYSYYLNTQGEEKAQEYFELLKEQLSARYAYDIGQMHGDSFGGEMYIQFRNGLDRIGQDFESFFGMLAENGEYTPASAWEIAGQQSMERLGDYGENIQIFGNSLGQVAGHMVNSTTYMAPSLLTTVAASIVSKSAGAGMAVNLLSNLAGSVVAGVQTMGGSYREAINSGHSVHAAKNYATLVGLSETGLNFLLSGLGKAGGVLTEKVLGTTISKLDNTILACAAKLGTNFVSEGMEEWLQYGLEGWFKNIALGTDYRVDMLSDEALYNGLIGAISASFMESASIVSGEVGTYIAGKHLQRQGLTGAQLQKIGSVMPEDIRKVTANLTETSSPYAIGKAFQEVGAFLSAQDQQQVVLHMVDQGVMLENAQTLVGIVEHLAAGGSLTQQQIDLLNANESLGQALMQTLGDPADPKTDNTQTEPTPGQTTSAQNAITQQNPAEESTQPQQAASTNQDLLQQAEEILDAENMSSQEKILLATYRQHMSEMQDLEQQQNALWEKQAELNPLIGTKFFNSNDLRNNGNLLSEVKRKLYDAENTLRKVMEKPAFSDFLQKLKEANATREENNSQNQINVLDSSDNLGIMETKESVENAVPQNSEAVAPVNIKLKFMQKWTPEQRQQAIEKLKALSLAKTVKQAGKAKNRSKRQLYKTSYGENSIPESYDVDHIVDIQLGGDPNSIDNLQVLDRSVNRSLGAQIMHAIKNYPPGTVFGTFTIE